MRRPIWIRLIALIITVSTLCGCSNTTMSTDEETSSSETAGLTIPEVELSVDELQMNEVDIEDEKPHEHQYVVAETVQATCIEEGYTVYTCDCGDSHIGNVVKMVEHSYEKTDTVEPTKEAEGYSIYVCKICFDSKRDDYVPSLNEEINENQRNSINMLHYLGVIVERIYVNKDNPLVLEELYDILLNNINPGKIDDETQVYYKKLMECVGGFIDAYTKRDRLNYLHNQDKANAIHSAVPNRYGNTSFNINFSDWKQLAAAVVFTVVDSYNNYTEQVDNIDREYLIGTWKLDDEETKLIREIYENYFNYMVDVVQKYDYDDNYTLKRDDISKFVEICEDNDLERKVRKLESYQEKYKNFANYWLELADCYYESGRYEECILCIETYKELSTGIFRKDYEYAKILPKVIVAVQMTHQSVSVLEGFTNDIIDNTDEEDWELRYFAARVYVDLYSRTQQKSYLERAYEIVLDNISELTDEQQELNRVYMSDIKEEKPDYKQLNDQEKKERKKEYEINKKYTEALKEIRKTELPPLYEPLIVNCNLLFDIADELDISDEEIARVEGILHTKDNGVFLSDTVNNRYSFINPNNEYSILFNENTIEIPANLLTQGATIEVEVKTPDGGNKSNVYDDWKVTSVKRNGAGVESFMAYYSSKAIKDVKWTSGTEVIVCIYNGKDYEPMVFCFKATESKSRLPFGTKITFEEA